MGHDWVNTTTVVTCRILPMGMNFKNSSLKRYFSVTRAKNSLGQRPKPSTGFSSWPANPYLVCNTFASWIIGADKWDLILAFIMSGFSSSVK